ncbi:MAG: GreA/GreB family elongation factor [Victivallales bacterium]
MTSLQNLENLFSEALASENQSSLDSILSALAQHVSICSGDIPEHIALLLEHWGDSIENSTGRSLFCYRLCELSPLDSPQLRNMLYKSLKRTLPPDISRNNAAAALGLKDQAVTPREIAVRFNKLRVIGAGQYFFSGTENKWGTLSTFDPLTGEIRVKDASGLKKNYTVSLQKILSEFLLFKPDNEMYRKLASWTKGGVTRVEWLSMLEEFSLNPLSEEQADKIAFATMLPSLMTLEQFNSWWKSAPAASGQAIQIEKSILSARNMKELHVTLLGMREKSLKLSAITDDEKMKLSECLVKIRDDPSLKEQILYADTLSLMIEVGCRPSQLAEIIGALKIKTPFWPEKPELPPAKDLVLWDELPSGHIQALLTLTRELFSKEYLDSLFFAMPLRVLSASAAGQIDYQKVKARSKLSADMLLYLWRNRSSVPENVLAKLNFKNIFHGISDFEPSSWADARKELKKHLIENQELQKYLLERHSENEEEIFDAMRTNKALTPHELQSLLVRMSRLSPEFKNFLEKNKGRGALNIQKTEKKTDESPIPVTSMKSYSARVKEFEDIINKHLPENTAAISHARSYGDLRENAEFSAAKERQGFLNKRKSELERDLADVIPCNFEKIENCDFIKVGTTVQLDTNGHAETYHIAGLWDSDPERNILSSDSRFSKTLVSKKKGESVLLPDGKTAVILSIESLPEEMIRDLNNEHLHS